MYTIYKYSLHFDEDGFVQVNLPMYAKILTIDAQGGGWKLWAMVNEKQPLEARTLRIIGTGWDIKNVDYDGLKYIVTRQEEGGKKIWHFFEVQ